MPIGIYTRTKKYRKRMSKLRKGICFNTGRTHFKKGFIPWHKGKKLPQYSGEKASHWKGGKYKCGGYIYILQPNHPFCNNDGYILEHRLILEKKFNRYLKPTEISHHINGIKDDNRPTNLELFTNKSKHTKFHHPHGFNPKRKIK